MHIIEVVKLQKQISNDLCNIRDGKNLTDIFQRIKEIFLNPLYNINIIEYLNKDTKYLVDKNFYAIASLIRECLVNNIPNPNIEISVALDFIHYIQTNVDNNLIYNHWHGVLREFLYIAIINTLNFNCKINANKLEEIFDVLNNLNIKLLGMNKDFKQFYIEKNLIGSKLIFLIEDMHTVAKYNQNLVSEAIITHQLAINDLQNQYINLLPDFCNVMLDKISNLDINFSLRHYNDIYADFIQAVCYFLLNEDLDETKIVQMMLSMHSQIMKIRNFSLMNNTLILLDKILIHAKTHYYINDYNNKLLSSVIISFITTLSIEDKEIFLSELNLSQLYKWLLINNFDNANDIFIEILNNLHYPIDLQNDKNYSKEEYFESFIILYDDFNRWLQEHDFYPLIFNMDIDIEELYKLYKIEQSPDEISTIQEFLECVYLSRYDNLTQILTLWNDYYINWDIINDRLKDEVILSILDNCIMLELQQAEEVLINFIRIIENSFDLKLNVLITKMASEFKEKFNDSDIFGQLAALIIPDDLSCENIEKNQVLENVLSNEEKNTEDYLMQNKEDNSNIEKNKYFQKEENLIDDSYKNVTSNKEEITSEKNEIKLYTVEKILLLDIEEKHFFEEYLPKENRYKPKNHNKKSKGIEYRDLTSSKQILFNKNSRKYSVHNREEKIRPDSVTQEDCVKKLEEIAIKYKQSNKFDNDYKFLFIDIMSQVLKFSDYHFYAICISVPEITSIFDSMPDNDIKKAYLEKNNALNLDLINKKLDKSMKSHLYSIINNNKFENYNAFMPYINLVNKDGEFLLLLYLKYTNNIHEGFLEFIADRMTPEFFTKLDENAINYLNATLSLHALFADNKKYANNLLLKITSKKDILSIINSHYFYTLPWYIFILSLEQSLSSKDSEVLKAFYNNVNMFCNYDATGSAGIDNFINNCLADIFIFSVDKYEDISCSFIAQLNIIFKTEYTLPTLKSLKYIIEQRIIDYLNIQPNVIASCILKANEQYLSYIITEKTLKYTELKYVSRFSLMNILFEKIGIVEESKEHVIKIKSFIKNNADIFTAEVMNNINNYAGFDKNGCVTSPNIMATNIFVKHETVTCTIFSQIMTICSLPKEAIERINPETFTKNIKFNDSEQINLFIMFCLCDKVRYLNSHKELIAYLLSNFNTLTIMNGKLAYLPVMMRFMQSINFMSDNGIISSLPKNVFNTSFEPIMLEIGINNISQLQCLTPTIGGDFITMPTFSCAFVMSHKILLDMIAPEILKQQCHHDLNHTTRISDFLKKHGKEEIITYLQELKKNNIPRAKVR